MTPFKKVIHNEKIAISGIHYWPQLGTLGTFKFSIIATFCRFLRVPSSEKKRGYIGREFFFETQNKKNSSPLGPLFFKILGTAGTMAMVLDNPMGTLLATTGNILGT